MPSYRLILSIILAAGVCGLTYYHRHEVVSALYSIDIIWAIVGLMSILANYYLRAVRFKVLTDNKLAVWPDGFYCTCMHGFATYMLPLRSGDLALPFLLKSLTNMELKHGAIVLYKARLLEIFTLGIVLFAVAILLPSKLPISVTLTMASCGALMAISPYLLKFIFSVKIVPFEKIDRLAKILAQTSNLTVQEITLTCGIWISIAFSLWCVTSAMQLPISVMDIFLLIALQLVMQVMPIQGFANSGNHESSWVAALVLMGCPAETALKFALTSHAIILVYVVLLGLVALILRHMFIR